MIDWKDLLPKKSSIVIWLVLIVIYYFVGCASYIGSNPCPYYCGIEHKHKMHLKDYDCEQEVCIHMIKKA